MRENIVGLTRVVSLFSNIFSFHFFRRYNRCSLIMTIIRADFQGKIRISICYESFLSDRNFSTERA